MTRLLLIALLLTAAAPATPPPTSAATRFAFVDVMIDSKDQPLAAYQFELTSTGGRATVVGIEGTDAGPFAKTPPYYDPAAMGRERAIIAAYTTDSDLPTGRTRVARVHVMIEGPTSADGTAFEAKLIVAADGQGRAIAGATAIVRQPM